MFGLSLPGHIAGIESLIANISSANIPFIEVQGELASDQNILSLIDQQNFIIINSYGYIDSNLLTNVIDQKSRLRDEIFDKLHYFINNPQTPKNITLDFGISYKTTEDRYNHLKIKHLRNLYKSIYDSDKTICLPLRVPGIEDSIQNVLYTLRHLMLNKFKTCLNIFPHELKNEQTISNLITGLKYNIGVIRLVYEPATGNYITEKLIKFCLETLKRQNLKYPIIFAPLIDSLSLLDKEINNIYTLRNSLADFGI